MNKSLANFEFFKPKKPALIILLFKGFLFSYKKFNKEVKLKYNVLSRILFE